MKKNYIYVFACILLCLCLPSFSTAQGWDWRTASNATELVKDNNDDLYAYFTQYSSITGDPTSFTIEKFMQNGTSAWTKTVTGPAQITAAQVDAANNLVIIGNLMDTVMIDTYTLSPNGAKNFFIVKISPAGTVLSASVFGNSTNTFANDLFITSAGDYLIGGGHTGSFTINGHTVQGDTLQNLFILKMDDAGNVIWSEAGTMYTMSGDAMIDEVVETSSGSMYATLSMFGGLVEFNGYQFTSSSGQHIVMMNSSRQIQWEDYLGYPGITFNTTTDIQTAADTAYMKEVHCYHGCYVSIYRWPAVATRDTMRWSNVSEIGYQVANGKVYYAILGSDDPDNPTMHYRKIGSLTAELSEQGEMADSVVTTSGYFSDMEFLSPSSFYIIGGGDGMSGNFVGKYGMLTVNIRSVTGKGFMVYPNPASQQLYIKGNGNEQAEVMIYNMLGAMVQSMKVDMASSIDISSLPPSGYIVEVRGTENTQRIMIVKQ